MIAPLVTKEQLESLQDGLYQLGDRAPGKRKITPRTKIGRYFDLALNEMITGPMVLMARVRAGGEEPQGVEAVLTRRDGKQVVLAWVADLAQKKGLQRVAG